jgi:hypothetical protein
MNKKLINHHKKSAKVAASISSMVHNLSVVNLWQRLWLPTAN